MTEPLLLAIESSCDDTAAAVLRGPVVLSNVTHTQVQHVQHGGVVPELASRQHQLHIGPVVQAALERAGVQQSELSAIAYTQGPGLIGSLLVGATFAKSLALGLGIPALPVNHLQGHLQSVFLADSVPQFPLLVLTVSGGHTELTLMNSLSESTTLGSTLDDAAGEAFDKIGKLLGLPYPAGPHLDKLATSSTPGQHPEIARPLLPGLDFSFSGLKTSVLYYLRKHTAQQPDFIEEHRASLCAEVQHIIVDVLLEKLFRAASQHPEARHLAIVGGVSANSGLRAAFLAGCTERGLVGHIPPLQYCTDNAAMIGLAGYHLMQAGVVPDAYAVPYPS